MSNKPLSAIESIEINFISALTLGNAGTCIDLLSVMSMMKESPLQWSLITEEHKAMIKNLPLVSASWDGTCKEWENYVTETVRREVKSDTLDDIGEGFKFFLDFTDNLCLQAFVTVGEFDPLYVEYTVIDGDLDVIKTKAVGCDDVCNFEDQILELMWECYQ